MRDIRSFHETRLSKTSDICRTTSKLLSFNFKPKQLLLKPKWLNQNSPTNLQIGTHYYDLFLDSIIY